MSPDQQARLTQIEQAAKASLPDAIAELKSARIQVAVAQSEIDRLDRAIDEARFRKQRMAGSRHAYLETRVQQLTRHLLGEDKSDQATIIDARDDTEDAAGLQGAIDLLTRRRSDEAQRLQFANTTVRQSEQRVYELQMRLAAIEYEQAREDIAAKWAKTQAMAELSGTGPTCDPERWSALYLPSITLSKFFRTNPHATEAGPVTSSGLEKWIRREKIQAREQLENASQPVIKDKQQLAEVQP